MPTHKKYLVLEAMLQDEDFEEVELPYVRLKRSQVSFLGHK